MSKRGDTFEGQPPPLLEGGHGGDVPIGGDGRSLIRDGLFVTRRGMERVESAFKLAAEGVLDPGSSRQLLHYDASFDDYYLGIYILNLTPQHEIELKPLVKPGLARLRSLRAMLQVDFPTFKPGMSFQDSILDETVVADLIQFMQRVRTLVPYPTSMEAFGLGCVWMAFGIYGKGAGKSRERDLPALEKKDDEADPEHTAHPAWRQLKLRFPVSAFELN